ncbi:RCC1/BLIP-II [Xylariaceae sp. FL0594]|nr:RCC1/BLIP-II [Xylariaceae sp. FL0594]
MDGLFALGSNGSGQLGLDHTEDVSVPKQVHFINPLPKEDSVAQVAAGGNHTILVTANGKAYWSGDPATGCCGTVTADEKEDGRSVFRELRLPGISETSLVLYAACTWDSTILVVGDEHGFASRVYICGTLTNEDMHHVLPDFPPPGTNITGVAAGFRHVVAVLDNGDVYGWGNGRKGQLGQLGDGGDPSGVVDKPRRIAGLPFRVAQAVCSQYATCLVAEPGDGSIIVLGADKWGLRSQAPSEVANWKAIEGSWGNIYILKRDGKLVAWGRDDHGQLPPPYLPEISRLAAGSEHVLALTEAGEVLAWGWGEHGNCGPHTDDRYGDVKGRWNVLASLKNLPEGSRITAIGAGCATSWINITADGIFL